MSYLVKKVKLITTAVMALSFIMAVTLSSCGSKDQSSDDSEVVEEHPAGDDAAATEEHPTDGEHAKMDSTAAEHPTDSASEEHPKN
jgi:hypothetical protein